ncbi:MAG: HEAT repeat domain-containing protein [Planctomycetes bacterium]|nr:HEAT repeat domain-containing protein [Planctomycetota bacterium]
MSRLAFASISWLCMAAGALADDRIETLVVQLGDSNWQVRERAERELVEIGREAIPELKDATQDEDPEIAARAHEALAEIRTQCGMPDPSDLARENQDLREQLEEFKAKIEHLKAMGIHCWGCTDVKVPRPLDGKIVAVNADVMLAMINLGEKEGVEKGMVFTVYRGESYIGQIVTDMIYPDMSSVRIDPRFLKEPMKEADGVTTRIR